MMETYISFDLLIKVDGTMHIGSLEIHWKTILCDDDGVFVFKGVCVSFAIFEFAIGLKTYTK